ncbi:MAG: asparagine synthetase 1, partial [Planctomycetota bacterium]
MCGFAGFVDRSERLTDHQAVLRAMSAAVAHRGPDGEGFFVEPRLGLGVAHRRLAIIDRTPAAAQPMLAPGGRWLVAYNGEIWNHAERRAELLEAGHAVGTSTGDTAVLAAMLEARGFERTLQEIDGMFAFVAVDLHERTLWLARDRFGVKPCFWGWAEDRRGPGVFVFGSELRALTACPAFRNTVSPFAIASVLGSLTTRGTRTLWDGVHAVEPGCAVSLDLSTGRIGHRRWFGIRAAAAAARLRGLHEDRDGMQRSFDGLVDASVRRRLRSDVPVGAFLSGGIDSSLVVAAMHRAGVRPLHTFTVGFEDPQ